MALVEIKNLNFKYNLRSEPALKDVCLSIEEGSFNLVTGRSGSGKTTLLKHLKSELKPHGVCGGEVLFSGQDLYSMSPAVSARSVGFVFQDVDEQIVTDNVFSELAFGPENLGYSREYIERRIAETAAYFGLHNKIDASTDMLSGGEKQLVNLAAVMLMQPRLLVLDEPTAQLDPIAASEFLSILKKINSEYGTTVVICEHRIEEIFPLSDNIILMDAGRVTGVKNPARLFDCGSGFENGINDGLLLPTAVRLFKGFKTDMPLPLSVNAACAGLRSLLNRDEITLRKFYEKSAEKGGGNRDRTDLAEGNGDADCAGVKDGGSASVSAKNETAVELKNVFFRYGRNAPDVLKGASLKVGRGELLCVMGGNGTGKSTALRVIGGIGRPYGGSVRIFGRSVKDYKNGSLYDGLLAALPQNPLSIFVCETVADDLAAVERDGERVRATAERLGITELLSSHPYDLSGGEAQKAALAKVLLTNPKILLLDEPTKGLDEEYKRFLGGLLRELTASGVTVVCATHDVEFAAAFATGCRLFFNGRILTEQTPAEFFNGNYFYTTAANRIARAVGLECITPEELMQAIVFTGKAVKEGTEST